MGLWRHVEHSAGMAYMQHSMHSKHSKHSMHALNNVAFCIAAVLRCGTGQGSVHAEAPTSCNAMLCWHAVQPNRRGEFNFTLLDYMVGQAQKRRQKVSSL